jgi:Leucine-rich repeat (LRR) protein
MTRAAALSFSVGLSVAVTAGRGAAPVKRLEISDRNPELLSRQARYPDLKSLSIQCMESLRALPDSIGALPKLKELIVDNGNGCSMNPVLPESIGNLALLEKLVLYGAQDPRGIGGDPPVQPKERHKFPGSMSRLTNLTYLDLGRNGLNEIPAFVGDLPRLRELRLQFNELADLPDFLRSLPMQPEKKVS